MRRGVRAWGLALIASACGGAAAARPVEAPAPRLKPPAVVASPAGSTEAEPSPATGQWQPWAAAPRSVEDAAMSRWFWPRARGGWRCFARRCEVLDDEGRVAHELDFECPLDLHPSPGATFAVDLCGDELLVVDLASRRVHRRARPTEEIQTIIIDDAGTVTLSVLPHGELRRLPLDGPVERLAIDPPPNKFRPGPTFILAAQAPWLAYSAGAVGGERIWSRAKPAEPLLVSGDVHCNDAICWTYSVATGESWRVDSQGKAALTPEPPLTAAIQVVRWGRAGLMFRMEAHDADDLESHDVELRDRNLVTRERLPLHYQARIASNPEGDRIYAIAPDGSIERWVTAERP